METSYVFGIGERIKIQKQKQKDNWTLEFESLKNVLSVGSLVIEKNRF